jgi:hypothetical protein
MDKDLIRALRLILRDVSVQVEEMKNKARHDQVCLDGIFPGSIAGKLEETEKHIDEARGILFELQ